MQVIDLRVQQVVDCLTVRVEVLEAMQVHHPQFLVLHHLHQCPKGKALILDVVQQHSCNHVHTLNVAHLHVIDAVGHEDLPQHLSKVRVLRKGRAFGVCTRQILLYLLQVLLFAFLSQQFLEGACVRLLVSVGPLPPPGTVLPAEAATFPQFFHAHAAEEGKLVPVEEGLDGTVLDALGYD